MSDIHEETVGVMASCGHEVQFVVKTHHEFLEAKIDKIKSRPCGQCRASAARQKEQEKLDEQLARGLIGGSQKKLPVGTLIVLKKEEDGKWSGTLDACDRVATNKADKLSAALFGLLGRANRWRREGYLVGPSPLIEPPPRPRKPGKSIVDRRDQWKGKKPKEPELSYSLRSRVRSCQSTPDPEAD